MILDYFSNSDLSLRRVAQAIHRMGLVLASLASSQRSYAMAAVVALILRSIDPEMYRKFSEGKYRTGTLSTEFAKGSRELDLVA